MANLNLTAGVDIMPAYTETMRFLNTEAGQRLALKVEDLIEDLVRTFHGLVAKPSAQAVDSSTAAPAAAQPPAKS